MRARRKLFLLVVLSAGLHGAGVYALAWMEPDRARVARPAVHEVIEISMEPVARESPRPRVPVPADESPEPGVTQPALPGVPGARSESPASPRRDPGPRPVTTAPAVAAVVPAPGPAPGPDPEAAGPDEPARPSLLAMRTSGRISPGTIDPRGPGAVDLSPARVARAMHTEPGSSPRSPLDLPDAPRIPGPGVERSDSLMVPDGNGTFRYDHGGFTAKVERDGTVHIQDKPSFQPFAEGPCLECVRRNLGTYVEDPSSGHAVNLMALLPKVGVRFDLTDWIMRQIGDDPYSFQKERFLDRTRDEREAMRRRETDDRLREALQLLPGQLDEIWAYEPWTVSRKKRALFELWDECAESGPEERVQLGRAIRATIVAFIRKRLPAGSEHAYTPDELSAFGREQKSRETFAPYAAPDE